MPCARDLGARRRPRARRTSASAAASAGVGQRAPRPPAAAARARRRGPCRTPTARRRAGGEHARHAERVGDEAGVLAAGAAEAAQRVLGDVVAALHRDVLDRVGHVLDGDLAGSRRRPPPACARCPVARATSAASAANFARTTSASSGCVAARAEHVRKELRVELADHDVAVGDGQRSAAAVAGRARDRRRPTRGPTRKRAPSNVQIEPPPAATVWMRIIGARRRTPATSVTNARSYSPA